MKKELKEKKIKENKRKEEIKDEDLKKLSKPELLNKALKMNLDTYNGQSIKRYNKPDIIKCILENKKN